MAPKKTATTKDKGAGADSTRTPWVRPASGAGGRRANPLLGPRPEPNLGYDKGKHLHVKQWLRQVPLDGSFEAQDDEYINPESPGVPAEHLDYGVLGSPGQPAPTPGLPANPPAAVGVQRGALVPNGEAGESLHVGQEDNADLQERRVPKKFAVDQSLEALLRSQEGTQASTRPDAAVERSAQETLSAPGSAGSSEQFRPTTFRISLDLDELSGRFEQGGSARTPTAGLEHIAEESLQSLPGSPQQPTAELLANPLDFVLDAEPGIPQAVAVAAGLYLAQAEAKLPFAACNEAKLRTGLCLAVEAKQQQAEAARRDLEGARALSLETQRKADERVKEAERQADVQRGRALEREAELSETLLRLKQVEGDYKQRLAAAEDREETLQERLDRIQQELNAFEARTKATSTSTEEMLDAARAEAKKVRQEANMIAKQLSEAQAEAAASASALQRQVDVLGTELRDVRAKLAAAEVERDEAIQGWEDEAVARMAAEASENQALEAISAHAGFAAKIRQKQEESEAMQRRISNAEERAAAAALPAEEEAEEQAARELARTRHQVHPAAKKFIRTEKKELKKAEQQYREAKHAAVTREIQLMRQTLGSAPEHLSSLGLAFRVYVVAQDASPGSPAGQVHAILRKSYRAFADPTTLQGHVAEDVGEKEDMELPAEAMLVRLAHSLVVICQAGIFNHRQCRLELADAAKFGRNIILVSVDWAGVDALGVDKLPSSLQDTFHDTWRGRIDASNLAAEETARAVAFLLGLPDAALSAIPAETLRLLIPSPRPFNMVSGSSPPPTTSARLASTHRDSPESTGRLACEVPGPLLPDLVNLNSSGLTTLRLDVGSSSGLEVQQVAAFLRGNSTLRHLFLKGVSLLDIPALAHALAKDARSLRSVTLGAGADIMLEPLRPSGDGCISAVGLRPLDVELLSLLLAEALTARTLTLGPCPALKARDLESLAEVLMRHPSISEVNSIHLERDGGGAARLRLPGASGEIELAGTSLGPLGGMLLSHELEARRGQSLTRIDLSQCNTGGDAFRSIASKLSSFPGLTHLSLRGNRLGTDGGAALTDAIGELRQLEVLDVGDNALGDEGARGLGRALRETRSPLRILQLAASGIKTAGAQALALFVKSSPHLKELHLQGNHVGDDGAKSLAAGLSDPACSLSWLDLSDNFSIGREGCRALGSALSGGAVLSYLNLSNNHIGETGAAALTEGIRTSTELSTLCLAQCKLKTKGVVHIADALQGNTSLRELVLTRNSAGDQGIFALCAALSSRQNQNLKSLDIRSNSVTPSGGQAMREMMRTNSTLRALSLAGNNMEAEEIQEIEALAASERRSRPSASVAGSLSMQANPERAAQRPSSRQRMRPGAEEGHPSLQRAGSRGRQ